MISRYAKIIMILVLAAFAFMVTFNNITDYNSNIAFVQHVINLISTFPSNAGIFCAVTLPTLSLSHAGS